MKAKLHGKAFVLTSDFTVEDIAFLENYSPEDLFLYEAQPNGTNKPVFEIGVCPLSEQPLIGDQAIIFNDKDAEGHAQITVMLPHGLENVKDFVADVYGTVINNLKDVEFGMEEKLAAAKERRQAILDTIEEG